MATASYKSLFPFPVQCSVFLYQRALASPCPVVLPGAYANPYGLRHLTDVWEMCALTHCQRAVPVLIRHDSLSLSLPVSLSPFSRHLALSAPFFPLLLLCVCLGLNCLR